jgi:hypothetical protein
MLGPEQVFKVSLNRAVANFGVAVTGGSSTVQPRVVQGMDENRLAGEVGLPFNVNPYLPDFGTPTLVAGAALPTRGDYAIVFDSAVPSGAGAFTFRFWIGDTAPPRLKLISARGGVLRVRAADAGSGIDPQFVRLAIDGRRRSSPYDPTNDVITASLRGLARGRHHFRLVVSDYQESKNMENVHRILPNTARLSAAFRIR